MELIAGTGGGVAERTDLQQDFPYYGTPQEQGDFISTQVNRVMARVYENEHQIHTVLGNRIAAKFPAMAPEAQKIVSQDLPAKVLELHRRGRDGGLTGGRAEPPPPIESLPKTLGGEGLPPYAQPGATPDATTISPNAPMKNKAFNYVPGQGFVPQ